MGLILYVLVYAVVMLMITGICALGGFTSALSNPLTWLIPAVLVGIGLISVISDE